MDENLILVLRMLERLLVVSFGGLSIYLGYKLFFHLPDSAEQEGKLDIPGLKIVLTKVGPGIFFLAFGAIILFHNLDSQIKQTSTANSNHTSIQSFAGAADIQQSNQAGIAQRRMAAIEKVGELNCLGKLLQARQITLPDNIQLALHDAKISLLTPVWLEMWGQIETPNTTKNKTFKRIFTDVSVSCPV